MTPRVLIVAGSDSGGGAGIQADVKTVTMLGGHAATAITALTAQNTLGVQGVHPVPAAFVVEQMRSVLDDIGADAVKIGMIGSAETAHAVADELERIDVPIVFDPVMVATSGSVLADAETVAAFERLMRLADLVTPNVPELEALWGYGARYQAEGEAGAIELAKRYGCAVLAKGGHRSPADTAQRLDPVTGEPSDDLIADCLAMPEGTTSFWTDPLIPTTATHGTGCTLASAIATGLARGQDLATAIGTARTFVRLALHDAPGLGRGAGPMAQQAVRLDLGPGPRLNQVTLPAADYPASCAFYRALGLKQIVDDSNGYARFEAASGATLSIHHGPTSGVYLEHDDVDGAVEAARAAGLTVETPQDQCWRWREAWLTDPAGNRVCLYRAGENRRFPPWRIE
jgi:hydroxymethylpyrimidine/phosphomethylpyrimidine kinase